MADSSSFQRSSLPRHVAVIMDGNGRWAKARGLPRTMGHRQGVEALKRTVKVARERGISYLTLFGFSAENWQRSAEEVSDLMGILRFYLKGHIAELHQENVCLQVIGNRRQLPKDIGDMIERAESLTADNTGLTLIVALSYGGRQEITETVRRIAHQIEAGALKSDQISADVVQRYLFTDGIPDPDLLIRTSGEKRLSNFLLWQMAYTELFFTHTLWPDFSATDLDEALKDYAARERRFGAVLSHA